jgi:hypothetical protein
VVLGVQEDSMLLIDNGRCRLYFEDTLEENEKLKVSFITNDSGKAVAIKRKEAVALINHLKQVFNLEKGQIT